MDILVLFFIQAFKMLSRARNGLFQTISYEWTISFQFYPPIHTNLINYRGLLYI